MEGFTDSDAVFHGLLLSSGFSSPVIREKVRVLVAERGYRTACIVTTAHPKKDQAPWNIVTKEQLEDMGLSVSFVDFDAGESLDAAVDIVYVCGGNTFHLLHSIRNSAAPIREQVLALCENGGLYIGSSAGAVIASSDISSAGEVCPDKNRDGVTDFRGLSFIAKHIIPHYRPSMDREIALFVERHGLSSDAILPVRNGEGVYVRDGRWVLIV